MNNSLIDFNFYNGDIVIKNFDCYTNSSNDIIENFEDQIKTMLYSLIVYDQQLKNEFLGIRIINKENTENEIKDFIMNKIINSYPLNNYIQLLELIVIIIKSEAYCIFYYTSPEDNKKKLLLDYNIKI